MKTKLIPLVLLTTLLTGCVGYNHTLFMTKSNIGLDFDAKPPTAEITIARREAVVAPSFEGGKTPPVMASFGTKTGLAKFSSFFMGVDQTFAGGDAAKSLAKHYLNPATIDEASLPNSALLLTTKPDNNLRPGFWAKRFLALPEPGAVRPFVFGTDTSLGLKVAWSGVTAEFPDTVRAGFNRKEFAWSPVFMTETNINGTTKGYLVQMPSFLATIDSDIKAETRDASIGVIQYFATGDAATQLTRHPGVRKALAQRSDPVAVQKTTEITAKNLIEIQNRGKELAEKVDKEIDRLADPKLDQAADALLQSGIIEAGQLPGLKAQTPQEKRRLLKAVVKDRESPEDVSKVEKYLNAIKLIP
jgi:hypothetical protein